MHLSATDPSKRAKDAREKTELIPGGVLPGAEQRSADIYAAITIRETRRPAAWFLEYFFWRAPEAYQGKGFAKLPDAEFGETLPLRTGG
jgi:hypothetical protein